jgi:hypothetical protein
MQKKMYADFYQALCFFAVILKVKIFSSTLVSFGPQNIIEKNKKTVCLFLKILNYLNSIVVLNTTLPISLAFYSRFAVQKYGYSL